MLEIQYKSAYTLWTQLYQNIFSETIPEGHMQKSKWMGLPMTFSPFPNGLILMLWLYFKTTMKGD